MLLYSEAQHYYGQIKLLSKQLSTMTTAFQVGFLQLTHLLKRHSETEFLPEMFSRFQNFYTVKHLLTLVFCKS